MSTRKAHGVAAGVALVALGLSSCSGETEASPTPTLTASTATATPTPTSQAPTPTSTPSTTPTADRWRAKFSKRELAAMDAAIVDWQAFGKAMAPYRKKPGDVEEVRAIFERYSVTPDAQTADYVRGTIEGGVRVVRPANPLYITGRSVTLNPKGDMVTFVQCTDYTSVLVTQNGKPIDPGVKGDSARLIVTMSYSVKAPGVTPGWRVFKSVAKEKPCA